MGNGNLILEDRLYTKDHEWIKKIGENKYRIGITDFAQYRLKDICGIELPKIGEYVQQSQSWGMIISNKATEGLYSPVSGKVIATNQENFGELTDIGDHSPTIKEYSGDFFNINKKPYETWLIEIETDDKIQLKNLLSPEDYKKEIEGLLKEE